MLLRLAARGGAVPVGVESEALGEPRAVRALDGLAETLDGWEDLLREIVLVVCMPYARSVRVHTGWSVETHRS